VISAQDCILGNIDWELVSSKVSGEISNRECHTPAISAFRWWARRPHRLVGAILDAATCYYKKRPIRVADPFSGGGTVCLEAVSRGMPVYAQELYPWPSYGLFTALRGCPIDEYRDACQLLLKRLQVLRDGYTVSKSDRELSHILRVRVGACPACNSRVYQFPAHLISLASRRRDEKEAYFGCRACGAVQKAGREAQDLVCTACETPLDTGKRITCAHCGERFTPRQAYINPSSWKPVLVQEFHAGKCVLRPVDPNDPVKDEWPDDSGHSNDEKIPDGIETRRLITAGFHSWRQLYTWRQVQVLQTALDELKKMDIRSRVKDRLAYAVIGCAEMAGYLSRWDRFHLKAFESVANHRYAHTTLAVETNLLCPLGRGTLPRRLKAMERGLEWLLDQRVLVATRFVRMSERGKRVRIGQGALVAQGNSRRQLPLNGSIDLVVTDPPYHDDVQYGELARLFHYWLNRYRPITVDELQEVVPNRFRGVDDDDYGDRVSDCLLESARTLSENGRLVLTFHNRKLRAWEALCRAFARANLSVIAFAVVRTENRADHLKRSANCFLHDLVLECAPGQWPENPQVYSNPNLDDQQKALIAAGIAIAQSLQRRDPCLFRERFAAMRDTLGVEWEWIS